MATAETTPHTAAPPEPRWGVIDAVLGWVVAVVAAQIIGGAVLAFAGYTGDEARTANLPLSLIALAYPPLWLGFVGVPVFSAVKRGNGLVRDFGARIKAVDLPLGLTIGVLSQIVLVPLVSWPLLQLLNRTTTDLARPARVLADKAHDPLGIVLLVLIVVIGAPIAEELFFRGLVLRSVERRLGMPAAIAISAVAFGLTHFEGLQTPALIAFGVVLGYMVHVTGRLGTTIVTHMAFNAVSITVLLVQG